MFHLTLFTCQIMLLIIVRKVCKFVTVSRRRYCLTLREMNISPMLTDNFVKPILRDNKKKQQPFRKV